MSTLIFTNEIDYQFNCLSGKDIFKVLTFDGIESVSELFSFTIDAYTVNQTITPDLLLTTPAHLVINAKGVKRYFSGIIGHIEQYDTRTDQKDTYNFYRIILYPRLWLLKHTKSYKIYQNQNATSIITRILKEHHILHIEMQQSATEQIRTFCVQYGESDFDFICRLMEEEGILYSFVHNQYGHFLILQSSSTLAVPVYEGLPMLQSVFGQDAPLDHVLSIYWQHAVVPSAYKSIDSNYMTPSTPLRAYLPSNGKGGTVTEYPGNFSDLLHGEYIASLAVNRMEWTANTQKGTSTALMLGASTTFPLNGHSQAIYNISYYVYRVEHHLSRLALEMDSLIIQDTLKKRNSNDITLMYSNTFDAIPYLIPYIPLRKTIKPLIHSVQTAIVVGPESQEVYTDSMGRIKIQFYWDTHGSSNENSSCWVRVAQGWAGNGFGSATLPRVGMEVLVTFLNGDPDNPIVTGCLYNGSNSIPASVSNSSAVSAFKSHSLGQSGHSNEFIIDDSSGAERIHIKAARDFAYHITNDFKTYVSEAMTTTVNNGDMTTQLNQGNALLTIEQGNQNVSIQTGNYTLTLGQGGITIQAQSDISITTVGNLNLTADGSFSVTASTISLNASSSLQLSGDSIAMSGNSMDISSTGTISISSSVRVTMDFPGKTQFFPVG